MVRTYLEALQRNSVCSINRAKLKQKTNYFQHLEDVSESEEEATTSAQNVTSDKQMRETLHSLAVTCDRFKVSYRACAAIASQS